MRLFVWALEGAGAGSVDGVFSAFLFRGDLAFWFAEGVEGGPLGIVEFSKPGTAWFASGEVLNRLLKVEPMSLSRLAAISASAAANAAAFSRISVSRLSFFASLSFIPRLLVFISSAADVSAVASVLRVSFPGT